MTRSLREPSASCLYEAAVAILPRHAVTSEFSKEMNADIPPCLDLRQNFNLTDLAVNVERVIDLSSLIFSL